MGTLLYDPQDIVIVGGSVDGDDFPDGSADVLAGDSGTLGTILFADVGNGDTPFQVYESEIEESAANIVLEARNSITASGTFSHIANGGGVGVIALQSGRNLTLETRNQAGDESGSAATPGIDLTGSDHLEALELRTSGGGSLIFLTGSSGADGAKADLKVGSLTTAGGSISLRTSKGDITTQALTTSGGDAPAGGGNGGGVSLVTGLGGGSVSVGSISARGGDASDAAAASSGGRGGVVSINTRDGDVTLGATDSSGGDSDGNQAGDAGGAAGNVTVVAGATPAVSDILLAGNVVALGGSGGASGVAGDGGTVLFFATGAVEHGGQAGPHVTTQKNVGFDAGSVGAIAPFVINGGGTDAGILQVQASGTARVDVDGSTGFDDLEAVAQSATADVRLTEGTDVVHVANSQVEQIDSTSTHASVRAGLQNRGAAPADPDLSLLVTTGSTHAGGDLVLFSQGDVRLGDSDGVAIEMNALPLAAGATQTTSGVLRFFADSDADHTGAVLDGVAGAGAGRIDLKGDADLAGGLIASSATGFGAAGNPIVTEGGGPLAVNNVESGGVVVRSEGSGDLVLSRIEDPANPSGATVTGVFAGKSGDIVLQVDPGSRIVLDALPGFTVVEAEDGDVTFDGAVTLRADSMISAGGDVTLLGTVDTDASMTTSAGTRVRSLTVSAAGLTRLTQDLGATLALRDVNFVGDVQVEGDRNLVATNRVSFEGDVFAPSDDAGSLAILSGRSVTFGGHVGEDDAGMGGRLSGFSIARNADPPFSESLPDPFVFFTNNGEDQHVRTGAGGLRFSPSGRLSIPATASVAKNEGDLLLESTGGTIDFGSFEKLTVGGRVDLIGDSVTIGDVSALELHVQSDTASVRTRPPAQVLMPSGGFVKDGGTDLIANVIAFSNPAGPAVLGSDPAPRIAAGSVSNTGSLGVLGLAGSISRSNLIVDDIRSTWPSCRSTPATRPRSSRPR